MGKSTEDTEATAEAAVEETESATKHAVAAASHVKRAGEIAMESARAERDEAEEIDEAPQSTPNGRIRRVGKGWIRR